MKALRIGFPVVHTNEGVGTLEAIHDDKALVRFKRYWNRRSEVIEVSVSRLKSYTFEQVRQRHERKAYTEINTDANI